MLRPKIQAPRFSNERAAKSLSMPVVPPSRLRTFRWKVRVGRNHWCSCSPPRPSGWSCLWSGPAPKPSADMLKAFTRSLDTDVSFTAAALHRALKGRLLFVSKRHQRVELRGRTGRPDARGQGNGGQNRGNRRDDDRIAAGGLHEELGA